MFNNSRHNLSPNGEVPRAVNDNKPSSVKEALRAWAKRQRHLPTPRKALLLLAINLADEGGRCWLLNEYFQGELNLCRRMVTYHLRALEADGLIAQTDSWHKRNGTRMRIYQLAPQDISVLAMVAHGAIRALPNVRNLHSTECKSLHPLKEEKGEKESFNKLSTGEGLFEEAFEGYPDEGRLRTRSMTATRQLWAQHAREVGPERLLAAVKAFTAASKRTKYVHVPGLHQWLEEERYRAVMPVSLSSVPGARPVGNVSRDLLNAFAAEVCPRLASKYLKDCVQSADGLELRPFSDYGGDLLLRDGRSFFNKRGISVLKTDGSLRG